METDTIRFMPTDEDVVLPAAFDAEVDPNHDAALPPGGRTTPLNDLILWKPGWPDPGDVSGDDFFDIAIG